AHAASRPAGGGRRAGCVAVLRRLLVLDRRGVRHQRRAGALVKERRRRNWGRWGDDDEVGAANLLTPEHVLRSVRTAASTGRVYPLAQEIRARGTPRSDSGLALHLMSQDAGDYATGSLQPVEGQGVAMDYLFLRLHGTAT